MPCFPGRILALALIFLVSLRLPAQERKQKADTGEQATHPNYVIFRVHTVLQERELFPKAVFFVAINGSAIVDAEGRILTNKLDARAMARAVTAPFGHKGDAICVRSYFASDPPDGATGFLRFMMKGIAAQWGATLPQFTSDINGSEWKHLMKVTKDKGGYLDDNGAEEVSESGLVRAYPVRTKLSRFWTRADCFVAFVKPIDKTFEGTLSEETKKNVLAAVGKLKLAKKDLVQFSIRLHASAPPKAEANFAENYAGPLAKELGFSNVSILSSE